MFSLSQNHKDNEVIIPKSVRKFLKKNIKCKEYFLPQQYAALSDFNKIQEGYRYNGMTNEQFVSDEPGKWNSSWYVIAQNEMDDPYFVDFKEEQMGFPVYFALHGCGKWEALKVASNIEEFAGILMELNTLTPPCDIDFLSNRVDLSNEFWVLMADELSYAIDDE